jgi:hypothetical protein
VLAGDLTDFTLPDVLRLLAFTGKTGRLTLDDGDRRGRLELRAGRVRDASADATRLPLARRILGAGTVEGPPLLEVLDGRETLPTDLELARCLVQAGTTDADTLAPLLREQTVDAVFDLVRWTSGAFRFVGLPEHDDDGALDPALVVEGLLGEVSGRLETWDELVERTGPLDAVVTIARPGDGAGGTVEVHLPPDGWGLLATVDGARTVADLVTVSGQGEHHTRRSLALLLDAGVVTVGDAQQAGPLERLLADQAALAAREGDLGSAVPVAAPAPSPVHAAPQLTRVEDPERTSRDPGPASPDPTPPVRVPAATPAARGDHPGDHPGVRPLRTSVRSGRLRADPTLDEDLVTRLIEGVEAL